MMIVGFSREASEDDRIEVEEEHFHDAEKLATTTEECVQPTEEKMEEVIPIANAEINIAEEVPDYEKEIGVKIEGLEIGIGLNKDIVEFGKQYLDHEKAVDLRSKKHSEWGSNLKRVVIGGGTSLFGDW